MPRVSSKKPKQQSQTEESTAVPPPPPTHWIQPWHVVLGDTSCRNQRTTAATAVLRQIKREARTKYFGQKKERWVPLAVQELHERLQAMPDFATAAADKDDIGRVLIKCTPKAMQSGRVAQPFLYGYEGDTQAWYGVAEVPTALEFFLTSRDGPQLSTELLKHQDNVQALLAAQKHPHNSNNRNPYLQQFGETLQFFQTQLNKAEEGNVLASKLLESLKPINALKEQWKLVQEHQDQEIVETPKHPSQIAVELGDATLLATNRDNHKATHATTESASIVSDEKSEVEPVPVHFTMPETTKDNRTATPFLDHPHGNENAGQQHNHFFYPVRCDDSEGEDSPSESDPLMWQDSMHLDKLDVDGFMADLELADEEEQLLLNEHHNACSDNTTLTPPVTGRRNRADSDCSGHSNKPRIKRSRKTGVTSAVAALATLATFVAVNTPSSRPVHIPSNGGGSDLQHARMLQRKSGGGLPNEDFDWDEQQQQHENHQQQDSSDWCKREEHNPFASLGGVGDFLCSLDLGSRFGFGDGMVDDHDDDGIDFEILDALAA